jgi:hypothetical protein
MTAQDLQRVINMAVLQGTDPTSGGGAAAFLQQAQSDFRFAGPPSPPGTLPHLVVQTANNDLPISSARLVSYLRQRWVVVVAIHKYVANVWGPTMGSRVKQVSFTLQAGHLVALAGFHGDETQASFIIHDPVYANVLDLPFTTLGGGGVRDSGLLLVSLPNGKTTELMVQYDTPAGTPVPVDASTLTNGQIVWFVHEYSALRLD